MGAWRCLAYMALWGLLCFPIGRLFRRLDLRWDRPPFRTAAWERDGAVYERAGIRLWKDIVPDVSRLLPRIVPRKAISRRPTPSVLEDMLSETCVAELIHWMLTLTGLALVALWPGAGGIAAYIVYVVLGNLPFIMIQRYNRPRFARMLTAAQARERRRVNAGSDTFEQ